MSHFVKLIIFFFTLLCCIQLVFMARLPRDNSSGKNGKPTGDLDVTALSNLILNRLKDNVKDDNDSVKNIVNSASDSLQRSGGMQIRVGALL